jgi:membrane protease YdiL (CAAX protease family)
MPTVMDPRILTTWKALLSSWDAWLLTFALVVLVPTVGYLRFRRLQSHTGPVVPVRKKLVFYALIIGGQWALVAAMLLVVRRHGLSLADVGEHLGDARLTFAVTLGLLAILAAVTVIVRRRLRRAQPATLTAAVGRLRKFSPAFGPEMAAFAFVCLTAGVCEELLYRGWLVNLLRAATGSVWVAIVAGAAVFAIGHVYQGSKAMLRTGFIGLQLAYLFVAVDSLIPGQVIHAAFDLVMGFALATAVSRLGAIEAESGRAAPSATTGATV